MTKIRSPHQLREAHSGRQPSHGCEASSEPGVKARAHLSAVTLDLLLMSGLTGRRRSEAQAHLDECWICRKSWVELNENAVYFLQFLHDRTLARVRERLGIASVCQ